MVLTAACEFNLSLPVHSCQVTHGVGEVPGSAMSLWVLQDWTVWVKSKVEMVNPVLRCVRLQ